MDKKKSRRIKYAAYKSLIPECRAYDYDKDTKTIMVDLPDDVLTNKEFTPDGWHSRFHYFSGDIYNAVATGYKSAEMNKKTYCGIAVYYCRTLVYDENHPYGDTHEKSFLNYGKAVAWCNEKLKLNQ